MIKIKPRGPHCTPLIVRLANRIGFRAGSECWFWQGQIGKKNGYGYIGEAIDMGRYANRLVHRVMWEKHNEARILPRIQIDHLCHERLCVNPKHLQPVTQQENIKRQRPQSWWGKTHCIRGHEMTEDNVIRSPENQRWRHCRECAKLRGREWARKKFGYKTKRIP